MSIGRMTCLLLVAALCSPVHAADKRPIQETDLLAFKWIADPRISPDGTRVMYLQGAKSDTYVVK